jgi:hypothetical protein
LAQARDAATKRIGEFRDDLRGTVNEMIAFLDGDEADSEMWFALSERLRVAWLMGSATCCMREWPEPNDATPDVERSRRRKGRRAYYHWDWRLAR